MLKDHEEWFAFALVFVFVFVFVRAVFYAKINNTTHVFFFYMQYGSHRKKLFN